MTPRNQGISTQSTWRLRIVQRSGLDHDYMNQWIAPTLIPDLEKLGHAVPELLEQELSAAKPTYREHVMQSTDGTHIIQASDPRKVEALDAIVAAFNRRAAQGPLTYAEWLPFYRQVHTIVYGREAT